MGSFYLIKKTNKGKLINKKDLININGFPMSSHKKTFHIKGSDIRDILIINKKLANPVVSKIVFKKYDQLLEKLTDLLIDDDDSGDSYREALNRIEKFRLETKIKYRKYLKKKDLEKMSKRLKFFQKEAFMRLMEIQNYYYDEFENQNNRRR